MRDSCRSVVICTVPRSGSWLLAELLELSGCCGRPREYFRPDYEAIYAHEWLLAENYSFGDFLAGARAAGSTPNGIFAVKLHWSQYSSLLDRLNFPGAPGSPKGLNMIAEVFPRPTFVHLQRDDVAAQAISWFRAIYTDTWWDTREPSRPSPVLPEKLNKTHIVTITRLETTLKEHNVLWRQALDDSEHPVINVNYADLCDHYPATARRLMRELGLSSDDAPLSPQRLRRQADNVSQAWLKCYLRSRKDK